MQLKTNKQDGVIRILQITDPHLGEEPGTTLLGMNTDESLQDVLDLTAARKETPDLVVSTGDIAKQGSPAAYERFLVQVQQHIDAPLAWLPGNHDMPLVMEQTRSGDNYESVIDIGNWRIVMLDSSVPGAEHGNLAADQLDHLRKALSDAPDRHTLVCLHHQPVPVGSAWIDQYVVRNADEFLGLVQQYPQVKMLLWGHVHQEYAGQLGRLELRASPSTCIQFKPHCDDFTVDSLMPGYRWLDLHADGHIETQVERIPEKHYPIDFDSLGY